MFGKGVWRDEKPRPVAPDEREVGARRSLPLFVPCESVQAAAAEDEKPHAEEVERRESGHEGIVGGRAPVGKLPTVPGDDPHEAADAERGHDEEKPGGRRRGDLDVLERAV